MAAEAAQHVEQALSLGALGTDSLDLGCILGTGLSGLAERAETLAAIDYADIPHFPRSTVSSHAGRLVLARMAGRTVLMQQGRFHLYEGYAPAMVVLGVRVMAELGVKTLVATNAAGCLNPLWATGEVMLLADHLNMTGATPLAGPNNEAWGPRFPDMARVYDAGLREAARRVAEEQGTTLREGVYAGVRGPELETPAETRMLRALGADAVGMSTVMEVIAARHLGLRVAAFSCLTNKNLPDAMLAGMGEELTLDEVIAQAQTAGAKLARLLEGLLPRM